MNAHGVARSFSTRLDAQHHACSSFLHGSCRMGGSNVHTVIRQPQLPVECPLCKKTADVANHESKSLSPFSRRSSHRCLTILIISSGAICLCQPSRVSGLQKIAQPCCNNTVPVARPFCCWDCTQTSETSFSSRTRRRGGQKRNDLCSLKSVVENKKRAEAWELIWRSQTMAAESQSTADGMHGSEKMWRSQPVESLSHRLERIELLNDHRDELLLQCAQSRRLLESFLCRTWLVEGDMASFQPFAAARAQGKAYNEAARGQRKQQMGQPFMSVFAAFVNGLTAETLGATGLEEVEMAWLQEFRKKLISALDVGRFLEMWNIHQYALLYDTGCAHQILLSQRMHRASPYWHTSYAKFFYTARASSRKAQHRRRTTSEKFRVNSSSAAREQRAIRPRG